MKIEDRLKISIKALSVYGIGKEILMDILNDLELIISEKNSEIIAKEYFRENNVKALVELSNNSQTKKRKMYDYQTEKSKIFTEDGQETFLKIRDKVQQLLKQSGAVMMQNAISGVTGDSWLHLACVDRLVELKEIQEITKENVAGQHRVFVAV